jgi:hypothetical protein
MEKKGKEKNKERRKGTDYLCTVDGQRGVGRIEERRPVAVTEVIQLKDGNA